MDAFENSLYLAAQGMNAFKMQQCIQRHGEIERAWHEERDRMVRKIYELDNLMGAWRVERRWAVQYLHEREIEMAEWSDEYLGMLGHLRRADIEAHAPDGDRDIIIQQLRRQYPTREDGRICRELQMRIQSARRTWREDTLEIEFLAFEGEEFWGLRRLFGET